MKVQTITRKQTVQREHKDLSTTEIQFRLDAARKNVAQLDESRGGITRSISNARAQLVECQRELRDGREDVSALEALVEARR